MTKKFTLTTAACAIAAASGAIAMSVFAADAPSATPTRDYAVTNDFNARASKPPTGDWTMWGGTPHRDMVSGEKNPPTDWDVGDKDDPKDNKNIKWEAPLG